MEEETVAPVEEAPAVAPEAEAALPADEPQAVEAAPAAETPAQPEAEPAELAEAQPVRPVSPLESWFDRIEARLRALENVAHGGQHVLDQSAIEQIAALVLSRINESISKHLEH